jgi:hypothetical protein
MADEWSPRATASLWALPETALCALKRCIPCAYKLLVESPRALDGQRLVPQCHANVRPELCPRMGGAAARAAPDAASGAAPAAAAARAGLYTCEQRILVVGDGDFSFSLALAISLGARADLVCTSYQPLQEVREVYAEAGATLSALGAFPGARVKHGVDATRLRETLGAELASRQYHRVIFNFPCVPDRPGADGQAEQLEDNKALIRGFLAAAAQVAAPGAEVHIVHKTREPFSWWAIDKLAPPAVTYARSVVFDRALYPGYIPRKVGEDKSFPVHDAVTFCFSKPDSAANAADAADADAQGTRPATAKRGKGKGKATAAASKAAAAKAKAAALAPSAKVRVLSCEPAEEAAKSLLSPQSIAAFDLVKLTPQRLLQVVSLLQLSSQQLVTQATQSRKRPLEGASNGPSKRKPKIKGVHKSPTGGKGRGKKSR